MDYLIVEGKEVSCDNLLLMYMDKVREIQDLESKMIFDNDAEVMNYLEGLKEQGFYCDDKDKQIQDLKAKISRRNMQIKDLKEQVKELRNKVSDMRYNHSKGLDLDNQVHPV